MSAPKPKPEPKILHTIDGIGEYDNPSPPWIVATFYATVVFALVYQVLFPSWFGPGLLKWSQVKKYDHEVQVASQVAAKAASSEAALGIDAIVKDPKAIEAGKAVYAANCAACHGVSAEGGIGPNLVTPPYWAYGTGTPADIEHIISKGTAKGMPAWEGVLGKTKVQQVTAFIYHLENPGK
ncbi:c-type cytochrome [bacterium]|nr:c-type cytochrome [bacterium]